MWLHSITSNTARLDELRCGCKGGKCKVRNCSCSSGNSLDVPVALAFLLAATKLGEGVSASVHAGIPPPGRRHPPPSWEGGTPRDHAPPGRRHPPSGIRSMSGRYASYWNAFLFTKLCFLESAYSLNWGWGPPRIHVFREISWCLSVSYIINGNNKIKSEQNKTNEIVITENLV